MFQIKILICLFIASLICTESQAQQTAPRHVTPEVAATTKEMLEAFSNDGNINFGETYGEMLEREEQEQAEEAAAASKEAEDAQSSILATVPKDSTIDYQGIADAFFPKEKAITEKSADKKPQAPKYEDVVFTVTESTSKVTLGMGHTIDIKIRTSSNLKWNFDKDFKSLEFLTDNTEDEYFHILYKAKAPGQETLYLDCLDISNPSDIKVLETKMVVIKVEE